MNTSKNKRAKGNPKKKVTRPDKVAVKKDPKPPLLPKKPKGGY